MKYIFFIFVFSICIFAESDADNDKEDVNLRIPIPFYSSDTGIGLSLYCKNISYEDIYRKDNEIMGFITSKGQAQVFFTNRIENIEKGIGFHYGLGYTDWKSTYYGIGIDEDSNLEEDYSKLRYRGYFGLTKEISEKSSLNSTYMFFKNKITGISEEIISENRDDEISGLNISYNFNNTDSKRNPKNGYKLKVSSEIYDEVVGSDVDFIKNTLDIKAYKEINSENHLAFQYVIENSSDNTPFYELYSLGSSMMIRGFLANRYIDNNFSGIQGEYKHRINEKWVGAFFGGFGTVNSELEEIYEGKWKAAAGIGLRYVFSEKENVKFRFDIGFNDDGGSAVYILFSEAL